MGNRVKAPIEAIGTYHLFLDTNKHIDLFQSFYVPSLSRNLVSFPKLDLDGYFIKFGNKSFTLFKNTSFVGFGILFDGLYKFNLHDEFVETLLTLHRSLGTKRGLINENSSNLWHIRLGYISRERLEGLVKDGILPNVDFTNLSVCVWIVLRANKPKTLRKVPQEVQSFLKLSTLTFVGLLMLHLSVKKNILSPL